MNRWDTPLGAFDILDGEDGVARVAMSDGVVFDSVPGPLAAALNEHLHGRASALRLDLQGMTLLSQMTLAKLLEIPYGEVRPYAWVAREIGKPLAIRAVASAVARNPIPILIPCHRVVRSDGHIGDFSLGGPELKRQLLEFEGVDIEALENLARRHVRFIVNADDGVVHLPSCRRAPDIDNEHRTEMQSMHGWAGKPLRACLRCKPQLDQP